MPTFRAELKGGALLYDRASLSAWNAYRRKVSGRVFVTVKKDRGQRSVPQLRWIRGVAIPLIADELGWDKHEEDDLHYHLLAVCFGTRTTRTGETVPNVAHSGSLNTKEAAHYQQWLSRHAMIEWGIDVPLPGEAPLSARGD